MPRSIVPATAPIVRMPSESDMELEPTKHATDVDELHDAVLHATPKTTTLDVNSYEPKLKPVTVTDAPPDCATF